MKIFFRDSKKILSTDIIELIQIFTDASITFTFFEVKINASFHYHFLTSSPTYCFVSNLTNAKIFYHCYLYQSIDVTINFIYVAIHKLLYSFLSEKLRQVCDKRNAYQNYDNVSISICKLCHYAVNSHPSKYVD